MNKETTKDWEEEFKEEFGGLLCPYHGEMHLAGWEKIKSFISKILSQKEKEIEEEWHRKGWLNGRKATLQEIIGYLKSKREDWALSLTYMADEKLDNQFETAKGHLDLILDELCSHLKDKINL